MLRKKINPGSVVVRGGHVERDTVVGNKVVTKDLTGKVIWLRKAEVWVPDNFDISLFKPFEQQKWENMDLVFLLFLLHM